MFKYVRAAVRDARILAGIYKDAVVWLYKDLVDRDAHRISEMEKARIAWDEARLSWQVTEIWPEPPGVDVCFAGHVPCVEDCPIREACEEAERVREERGAQHPTVWAGDEEGWTDGL